MKFVGYMLFVLSLVMFRSYAHEREVLWKNASFYHGYVTCLYVPFYLVGDACTEYVAILIVYVSFLACCSALCLFEKHMLAFVDLIHALPTRGRNSNPIIALGRNVHQGGGVFASKERNAFVQGEHELAFMQGELFVSPEFSCALLPVVLSRCPCLRGPRFFSPM
jgi:hypothetical protein